MAGMDKYLRASQIATILGVTRATVFNMLKAGKVATANYYRTPGGQFRVKESAVHAIAEALGRHSNP
jgi:excisionase family DNA binding protein